LTRVEILGIHLLGETGDAGLYIARAEDQPAASEEMRTVIATLVTGLAEN
jgi:hypothetical protein